MRIIIYLGIIFLVLYGGAMSYFYIDLYTKNKQANLLLEETQAIKKKLEDEITHMDSLQQNLQKENEQLKKESLSYLKREKEINEKCQSIEKLIKEQSQHIKDYKKQLQAYRKKLEELKVKNLNLSDINELAGNVQVKKLEQKIVGTENALANAKEQMKKQEALLHYNLGVSYTKDRNYEMAIDEYDKVLSLNPKDADTHYNLAVIYDEYRKNSKRAIEHYKKYLELKPDAVDIDEVKDWIARLEK